MQTKYYIIDNNIPAGPFSASELQQRGISTSTLVWIDSRADWVEAGKVDELQRIFMAAIEPEAESEADNSSPAQVDAPPADIPPVPTDAPAAKGVLTPHARFAIAASAIFATILLATLIRIAGTAVLSTLL